MTATAFAILRKGRLNTMTISAALQIATASFVIILTATNIISAPLTALILIGVAALGLLESRPALRLLLPF